MLLIAGDDIDDDAVGFTDSSLQGIGTLHHEHAPSTHCNVCIADWAEAIAMRLNCSCRQALTVMTANIEAWLVCWLLLETMWHLIALCCQPDALLNDEGSSKSKAAM